MEKLHCTCKHVEKCETQFPCCNCVKYDKWEPVEMNQTETKYKCETCKHSDDNNTTKKACTRHNCIHPIYPEYEEFKPEPDYSFSKEIQDALWDGKEVWCKSLTGNWRQGALGIFDRPDLVNTKHKWALEKPKTKVKKWQWILKQKNKENKFSISDAHYKNSEEANKRNNGYYEAVEPYLPSEVEEFEEW